MPALLALAVACVVPVVPVVDVRDSVNRVVGDASAPADVDVDSLTETERIELHLAFVSASLRATPTAHLRADAARAREKALDDLDRYAARGVFPRRTNDSYDGRRPRFVDDRGVYCAVGQLMADSGHTDLANAVSAAFEYAYVDEMDDARIVAWADAHGFTALELARIQPSYEAAPTEGLTRNVLTREADRAGLECAVDAIHASEVVVDVTGEERGAVVVQPKVDTPFSRCVAQKLSSRGGGAYDSMPQPYRFSTTLAFATPAAQLQAALRALDAPSECHRRPGPLVRKVRVDVRAGEGLMATVTTEPSNAHVSACVTSEVDRMLARFARGTWRLSDSITVRLRSGLEESVQQNLPSLLESATTTCFPADGRVPERVKAWVRAGVDDAAFYVDVIDADAFPALAACIEGALPKALLQLATTRVPTREAFAAQPATNAPAVPSPTAFFDLSRIDEAVDVRGEARVMSPAAAEQERRAAEARRYSYE